MSSALDMALDDVIGTNPRKGGGKQSKGKRSWGRPADSFEDSKEEKLDKSLDEIVDGSFDRGKSKGKGKKGWNDDWGGKGFNKGFGKGKGKGYSKGQFEYPEPRTPYLDRDRDHWSAKGSGRKGGAPMFTEHDDERGAPRRDDSPWDRGDRVPARRPNGHQARDTKPAPRPVQTKGGFLRIEQNDDEDDEPPRRRRVDAGRTAAKRPRARSDSDERPKAKISKKTATKTVKVTNIPKELKARDVREAFESETGKATSCELQKGVAHITFTKASDAVKAVEAFHKGELNGKIISVVLTEDRS